VGKPIRLLVVDDYKPWREWLRSKLGDSNRFQIVEADDGYDALAKAHNLDPDLVLLDISMPGLNGIETASLLREAVPRAKIVFLSQNNDSEVVRAALHDGGSGYVLKTEAERDLLPSIEAVFEGESFCSKLIRL